VDTERSLLKLVRRKTPEGRMIMNAFDAVLLVNIFCTMIGTMPEIDGIKHRRDVLFYQEMFCNVCFLTQYVLRITAYGLKSATKPARLLDLFCLLPLFMADLWIGDAPLPNHTHNGDHTTCAKGWFLFLTKLALLCRVFRVLDFPWMRRHFGLMASVAHNSVSFLAVPIFFFVSVWILTAMLFCWVETYYDGQAQRELSSIPQALYWASIFLVGEWSIVDFSSGGGNRLCIMYCFIAIMVYAILTGIVGEAMQTALMKNKQHRARLKDLKKTRQRLEVKIAGTPKRLEAIEETLSALPKELLPDDLFKIDYADEVGEVSDYSSESESVVSIQAGEETLSLASLRREAIQREFEKEGVDSFDVRPQWRRTEKKELDEIPDDVTAGEFIQDLF